MSVNPISSTPTVLKFGGSSVADPERMRRVAAIVAAHRKLNSKVIVVVSAMGDATDDLISLARAVSPRAHTPEYRREMDMLLSTGERVSMSLLSMALADLGVEAISLTGSQSGIITDEIHGGARIAEIRPIRIDEALPRGQVVIVAGFQGVSRTKEITTLGRGGSDTTAVALAAHFGARECLIYTDVDGVYSADPRKVPNARRLERMGWDAALETAARGAQVLHPRCVELGWKHNVAIRVRSTFEEFQAIPGVGRGGTLIEGCASMSLEGSKFLSLAVQRSLVGAEAKTDLAGLQKLREKAAVAGLELVGLAWENGVARCYVEEEKLDSAAKLEGLRTTGARYARFSAVGCGLLQSPTPLQKFAMSLSALKVVALQTSPTIFEAIVEESAELGKVTPQIHDALLAN